MTVSGHTERGRKEEVRGGGAGGERRRGINIRRGRKGGKKWDIKLLCSYIDGR